MKAITRRYPVPLLLSSIKIRSCSMTISLTLALMPNCKLSTRFYFQVRDLVYNATCTKAVQMEVQYEALHKGPFRDSLGRAYGGQLTLMCGMACMFLFVSPHFSVGYSFKSNHSFMEDTLLPLFFN